MTPVVPQLCLPISLPKNNTNEYLCIMSHKSAWAIILRKCNDLPLHFCSLELPRNFLWMPRVQLVLYGCDFHSLNNSLLLQICHHLKLNIQWINILWKELWGKTVNNKNPHFCSIISHIEWRVYPLPLSRSFAFFLLYAAKCVQNSPKCLSTAAIRSCMNFDWFSLKYCSIIRSYVLSINTRTL